MGIDTMDKSTLSLSIDVSASNQRTRSASQVDDRLQKPLSPFATPFTPNPTPRPNQPWRRPVKVNAKQRARVILGVAQKYFASYTSTVLEVCHVRGRMVMWTSVPEELKHLYNVTDLKT